MSIKKSQVQARPLKLNELSDTTDKDYSLWRLLHQAHLLTLKVREKELREYRITFEEAQTLGVIKGIQGKPTIPDISHISIKGYHTVSALINRMEKRGLIKKERESDSKKAQTIKMTEKGKAALRFIQNRESITATMSVFTEAEKDQLIEMLKRMRDSAVHYSAVRDIPDVFKSLQ